MSLLSLAFSFQCTVTCGQGLRYRVVLCIDHRGMHTGGCSPKTKPHIKEECVIPTPCYKPKGNSTGTLLPVFSLLSIPSVLNNSFVWLRLY